MSFGVRDGDWIDPPEPPECGGCDKWEECPCGCGNGWCREFGCMTERGDRC